jgi:nicotinamidase-related amidase
MLLDRRRSHLMIIDVQSKLAPHISGGAEVITACERLARYARRLDVPITITEQYPKGLGPTVPSIVEAAGNAAAPLTKIAFSCWRDDGIRSRLQSLAAQGRNQVVIAGTETHVCVGQTTLSLLDKSTGLDIYLVADAVGSRRDRDRDTAIARLRGAGAQIVTQEMVAFEWLERGGTPEFQDLIGMIK